MSNRSFKILSFFAILIITFFVSDQRISGATETKRVLFISSYHASFDTVPDQITGLRAVFDTADVEMDIDFMDTKRFNTQENYTNFYNFLKYRIDRTDAYDLVLVGDDNGLQFLLDHRATLFTDIPLVFFCINDVNRAQVANSTPHTAGIIEGISIDSNISMALDLFPKTESIIGIVDDTNTGLGDAQLFMDASTRYSDVDFKLLNASQYSFDAFKSVVGNLDDHALIFYLSMFEDKLGRVFTMDQSIEFLNENAQVPIFRMSVGGVGSGVFGGNMVSYTEQGRLAAEMALSIMNEENSDTINLVQSSPNKNFFDYNKMKLYGIALNDLPKNSVVINGPTNYFEKYQTVLIPTSILIVVLGIFMALLIKDNRKLKANDKKLFENNLELSSLYDEIYASEDRLRSQFDNLLTSQKALNDSEERYKKLAFTDTLTELNNRPAVLKFLDDYVKDPSKEWSLLYIDLDNFKYINDSRGHEVGDEILQTIGQRLNQYKEEFVYISRLGGDEFVIVVNDSGHPQQVNMFAKKLMNTINMPIEVRDMIFYLTCSIGVSTFPKDGNEKNILLRKADMAMYHAKASGRSRCVFFNQQIEVNFTDQMMIQNKIRLALEQNEFELYYQPQYDIKNNEMCGCEALIRWQDSNQQFISPEIFIPIAEEQGIIGLIGQWVFNEAAKQAAEWQANDDAPRIKVSVNVSASEIIEDNFGERFVHIVEKNGFKCQQIAVEITETVLITAKDQAIKTLSYLRSHNIEIHLDDFGSGFSSLNYLIDLPLDVIKIDRAFIKDLTSSDKNKDMAKFIIDISHRFHLKVIAEGVETKEEFDLLHQMGCDMIQGYYYGKPMNAVDIEDFYHSISE